MTYVPEWMPQPDNAAALSYAKEVAFASVVVATDEVPAVSHVPVFVDTSDAVAELRFHLAASNPMVDLVVAAKTLLIFRGPDGYVSPQWYDHENVPTWDYKFVHLSGTTRKLKRPELKKHVLELVERFDPELPVSEEYVEKHLDDIRGFAIVDPRVQPVFKLSQDKSKESIESVISGLRARGDEKLADAIKDGRNLTQQP